MSQRRKNIRRSKEFYSQAVKILRRGYFDVDRGRRAGKLVDGFEASEGFDLRYIDQWSPSQKARVTRAFEAVDQLSSRPHKIVRPRKARNLKRLQQASQHRQEIKGLKVAFVPVADPSNDIEIKYTKTAVKVKEKNVGRWYVELDPQRLLTDPEGEIREKADANPARVYNVSAGEFFIREPLYSATDLVKKILELQNKYNAEDHDPDDSNSSYWENWLGGFIAYNYDTPKEGREFRKDRTRYKKIFKDRRRAHRRKIQKLIEQRRKQRDKMRGR